MNPSPHAPKRRNAWRDALDSDLYAAVLNQLRGDRGRRPGRAVILAGEIGAGKTAAALRLVQQLRANGTPVGGVLAPRLLDRGQTTGYNALDLMSGEDVPFARTSPPGIPVGRFFVRESGLEFARRALQGALDKAEVVVVDEIGRWELDGGGHAATLRRVLQSTAVAVLLVRTELVDRVVHSFSIDGADIIQTPDPAPKSRESASEAFWAVVNAMTFPLLVTLGEDGFPTARPMRIVDREGATLWFPTSRSSQKVAQVAAHPQVTLLFVDNERFNYASLHGRAVLEPDVARTRRAWREEWRDDWPGGAEDPDYALLRVDGVRGLVLRGTTGESGEIDLQGGADFPAESRGSD
ncbi:MAG: nucleoside-triphosphatase [Candidatus Bipolaricaulota bacterium]